jgi:hypothetical protein
MKDFSEAFHRETPSVENFPVLKRVFASGTVKYGVFLPLYLPLKVSEAWVGTFDESGSSSAQAV